MASCVASNEGAWCSCVWTVNRMTCGNGLGVACVAGDENSRNASLYGNSSLSARVAPPSPVRGQHLGGQQGRGATSFTRAPDAGEPVVEGRRDQIAVEGERVSAVTCRAHRPRGRDGDRPGPRTPGVDQWVIHSSLPC